jgi:hypothetical protein
MELIQKKGSNKHTFTFHDDYFNYAIKDKMGLVTKTFDMSISLKSHRLLLNAMSG